MNLEEGQIGIEVAENDLVYPGINSCLSITMVLNDGRRVGGHAILIPEGTQQNLDGILRYIANNAPNAQRTNLYIIGDIGTWNQNLNGIRKTHNIPEDVHDIVVYIQQRLAVANNFNTDTNGITYNVCFNRDRSLVLRGHGATADINLPNW